MSEPRDISQSPLDRPPVPVRQAAVRVARELIEHGHEALFAGGCVRDRLMGNDPADYDIATDARPEQVQQLFHNVRSVGASFGVMLVRLMGHTIEVATFRTDGVYSDSRHPDEVTFSDAEHDAQRRDFTINGLFEHPLTSEIIDYVGGENDLRAKIIRAIGDAESRLREDRLRMLRAVRFAARFGFAIEGETAEAIRSGAGQLEGVSRERIGDELRRMLSHRNRAVAAWELQYLALDGVVLREQGQVVAPTRLGRLPEQAPYPTALSAWLLDRHESSGADLSRVASQWAAVLMLSNDEHAAMTRCLDVYRSLRGPWETLGVAAQKRLAASEPFQQGLMIMQASDRPRFIDIRRRVSELAQTGGLAPKPLLDGQDLIDLGLTPGPRFGPLLEAIYDAQLEGGVTTREEAIKLATILTGRPDPAGG